MGNTVLESTGLGSTLKRIRYSVSGIYICDGIELVCKDDQSEPLCICLATIILS